MPSAQGNRAAIAIAKEAMKGTGLGLVFGMIWKAGIMDPQTRAVETYYKKN